MELYFTEEEMKDFLRKQGYDIKTIKTWRSYNTYHNQVENNSLDLSIALKGDLNEFNNSDGEYRYDSVTKYSVTTVFTKEIKNKLLSL